MFSIDRWSKLAGLQPLKEAVSLRRPPKISSALAAGQLQDEDGITIVIYDPVALRNAIESLPKDKVMMYGNVNVTKEMSESIEGMIRISPPAYGPTSDANSCRGAWEVLRSAVKKKGTGMGSLLYKLASDASPTGKIMSDRRDVSGDAQNMWKSAYSRMSPEKKEETRFDDEENPRTEDPNDDCKINPSGEFLNHAFDDIGRSTDTSAMFNAHENFMGDIASILPEGYDFKRMFWFAALDLFGKVYE